MYDDPAVGTASWREFMLIGGLMWQHTSRMMATMHKEHRCALEEAKERLKLAKVECRNAQGMVALWRG